MLVVTGMILVIIKPIAMVYNHVRLSLLQGKCGWIHTFPPHTLRHHLESILSPFTIRELYIFHKHHCPHVKKCFCNPKKVGWKRSRSIVKKHGFCCCTGLKPHASSYRMDSRDNIWFSCVWMRPLQGDSIPFNFASFGWISYTDFFQEIWLYGNCFTGIPKKSDGSDHGVL